MKKIELLAPAGGIESLYAAVNNGCDAVYFGGKQFNARGNAQNFLDEDLKQAVEYCHLRGVKAFITLNILYKQSELENLYNFISYLYKIGVDSVIIQDMGAFKLIKNNFPNLSLNASTQLTAHSLDDVKYLEGLGFKRVVLSRELSLDEIKEISKNTNIEIECFIHGALCVCYSGQCLFSSMIGGRSGNRGKCAQPCRLNYSLTSQNQTLKTGYLLSPKDINTIEILPELIESGIDSFKIEGRMKRAEYVAGVVSIYRKYIDLYLGNPQNYHVAIEDLKILEQIFNRGGFTKGYFNQYSGISMMSTESPKNFGLFIGKVEASKNGICKIKTVEALNPGDGIEIWTDNKLHEGTSISKRSQKGVIELHLNSIHIKKGDLVYRTYDKLLMDNLKKTYEKHTRKMNIYGKFEAKLGSPIKFTVWNENDLKVETEADLVEESKNQPMSEDTIKKQIAKTGETPFEFKTLDIDIDKKIYIPISKLNEFRRVTLKQFSEALLNSYKRQIPKNPNLTKYNLTKSVPSKKLNVLVTNYSQLIELFKCDTINRIYFELNKEILNNIDEVIDKAKACKIELFAALPRIQRKAYKFEFLETKAIDGYLVRTLGQLYNLTDTAKALALDYNFNLFNSLALNYFDFADTLTLSPELTYNEIDIIGKAKCETLIYGFLPLMVTTQCPIGNYISSKKDGIYCSLKNKETNYYLNDRLNLKFNIMTNCDECIAYILNSQPILLLTSIDEILKLNIGNLRLQFTNETSESVNKIIYCYSKKLENPKFSDNIINNVISEFKQTGFTKGHYFRGVE